MTENQLKALIRQNLLTGLQGQGINDVPVIDSYQPTGQGRDPKGIYFFKLTEPHYGWQHRKHLYDPATGDQVQTETQLVRTTFQIGGFADANPLDSTAMTAADITGLAAMLLICLPSVEAFRRAGVGLERVAAIRTLFFENDRGQHEAAPSFDITLSHKQILTLRTPSVDGFEHVLTRV